MLVNTVLDALKQPGISKVALVVFEKNVDGNAFWEKQGFYGKNRLILPQQIAYSNDTHRYLRKQSR